MDASLNTMNAINKKNNSTEGIDPTVGFLYKTMLERDPRKRRVKPVPRGQVQMFGGLEDSEEDSDFDISKHSLGHDESPGGGSNDDSNDDEEEEEEDGSEETDDDVSDDDDDSDDVKVNTEDTSSRTDSGRGQANASNNMDEDGESDDEEEDGTESESDQEDDDIETDDDDDAEEDGDEEDAGASETQSPEIKGLGHVWNMFDSDEDDEDYVPRKKRKKTHKGGEKSQTTVKGKTCTKKTTPDQQLAIGVKGEQGGLQDTAPQGRIKVIVCCVCLSDRSADDDEIVECDNCGISVHEGCYGISESHSTASTESSASTEPWFCDACKANAKPVCELCPNIGGIFKETDNGKWVHIVCALYTPGVAFGDVDKLSLVTLFEMPYSKWGARECSLCEDSRFSQTGVCINCDAGMCKAYFHVTCAQREGLLAEASPEEVMDIADPFFAYCKLHADKVSSKIKRRNWLAIQSHVKTHTPTVIEDEREKLRFNRKLSRHREKYSMAKLKRPPSWVPTQKMVRHLHTSPSAVHGFLRKAELMGVITQAHTVPLEQQEVRKKAQGQPGFTSEFISYFMDRNIKLDNLKISLVDLSSQNNKLQAQERVVRKKYDTLHAEVEQLHQKGNSIRREAESLCGMLQDIYGKPVPNIPEIFKTRKRTRSPSKKETPTSPTTIINQCGVCHNTTEQHLLAKCDRCNKHYHLGCLDPPLTRMPKKTKLFGWQCSYCVSSSSDSSMKSVPNVDGPRKLRETIKEPDKFFHLSHIQDSLKSQQKKSLMNKKNKQRREAARARREGAASQNVTKSQSKASHTRVSNTRPSSRIKAIPGKNTMPGGSHSSPVSAAGSSNTSVQDDITKVLDIMCVVCNKDGFLSDTVRCDECMLFYHLHCLDPPMKKSPKVRGYAWHCEACDMLDSSDNDSRRGRSRREESQPNHKRPTGREASNSILFDIDVSSDNSSD